MTYGYVYNSIFEILPVQDLSLPDHSNELFKGKFENSAVCNGFNRVNRVVYNYVRLI